METKKAWYQHTIITVLSLTFFFPVGLYLMWRYSDWNKWAKIIITGFFALFVLSIANSPDSADTSTDTQTQTPQTENSPTVSEEAPTAEPDQSSKDFSLYAQSMLQVMPLIDSGNESIIKAGEYGQNLEMELASMYIQQAQESYEEARNKLDDIQVPVEAEEIHGLLTKALDEYLLAVSIYQEGVDTMDADRILEGVEHYNAGTEYINQTTEKITEKTEDLQS